MQTSSINRQRGSIIIPVAVSLVVGLILLGGVQLAYYFFMKRELQNTADLAALSAVQLIEKTGTLTCDQPLHPAQQAAAAIITENFEYGALSKTTVSCGVWDPVKYAEKEGHFTKIEDEEDNVEYNAILVDLTYDAIGFMPFSTDATIRTKAIAKKNFQPVAVFSVGASLLELDEGALTNTLSAVGLDLFGTSLGSFKGLADAKIKTSGLLENILGEDALDGVVTVGDLNTLLATEVGLGSIMVAAVKAAGHEEVIGAKLLGSIGAQLNSLTIPLGSVDENGRGGLFAHIVAPSAQAALNTMVGMGDILNVVLGVATTDPETGTPRAINLPLNIDLGLLKVEAKVGVIEPPSIGIGGPGATAYSASVRAFLRLCVDLEGNSCDDESNEKSYGLLKLKIDIPIGIEVVTGHATLGPMCEKKDDASGKPIAEITTNSTVLGGLCIGDITEGNVFSTDFSCANPDLKKKNIALLKLLNLKFELPPTKAAIKALSTKEVSGEYIEGQVKYLPNDINLGKTINDLVEELFGSGLEKDNWSLSPEEKDATAIEIWNKSKENFDECTNVINDKNKRGYECRHSIRMDALNSMKNDFEKLPGNTGLISDLLEGLEGLLGELVGFLLGGGDKCASKLQITPLVPLLYGGDQQGCISKIGDYLEKVENSAEPPKTGLSPLLALVVDILEPLLNMLGGEEGVLTKLLDSLGFEVNKVRTELISLDCDSAAQLVY